MVIVNFFVGMLVVALGVAGLKFNFKIVNMFGRNNVFEAKLGPGSTYFVFQLLSVLLVLFGIAWMFSFHDNIVEWLLSPLLSLFEN